MTIEEQDEIYKKGFESGIIHQSMAPETKEKLDKIEQELKDVRFELSQQDIKAAERGKDIEFIKVTLERIESNLMNVIENKRQEHDKLWGEIKPMRDWQIKIGTKIAVWAGIGTFVSGVASSLLVWYLTK